MSDFGLKISGLFCLFNLAFAVAFGLLFDGINHCELAIASVVVMEAIGMHHKVNVDAVGLVDDE
jgi:hypothetical protein